MAEYGIRIVVAASQEYVNTYPTRRVTSYDYGFRTQDDFVSTQGFVA